MILEYMLQLLTQAQVTELYNGRINIYSISPPGTIGTLNTTTSSLFSYATLGNYNIDNRGGDGGFSFS